MLLQRRGRAWPGECTCTTGPAPAKPTTLEATESIFLVETICAERDELRQGVSQMDCSAARINEVGRGGGDPCRLRFRKLATLVWPIGHAGRSATNTYPARCHTTAAHFVACLRGRGGVPPPQASHVWLGPSPVRPSVCASGLSALARGVRLGVLRCSVGTPSALLLPCVATH